MGNLATASRRESDPFPQPGLGAYKGTLWDPAAKIAPGQVARNSNLKLGDTPRLPPGPPFLVAGLLGLPFWFRPLGDNRAKE